MEEWTIRSLIDKLNRLTKLYDEGRPEVSDAYWDELYFKLKEMEKETGIIYPDSPTQNIHFEKVSELKKVKHNHPMLSLDKTKNFDDIRTFLDPFPWIAMAKLDGLTCSLKYINGELISAETRGNGIEGEDVTHNAKIISSIPQKINYKDELIVDGEVICTYENFEQFKNDYKNPRNFASGSIRLLDSEECANRNLTFIAWDIINKKDCPTLTDKLQILNLLNFKIVPYFNNSSNYSIEEAVTLIKNSCKDVYPIDGIVFKYDNIDDYEAAGRTEHHFKGGLAYKFYDETYETEVKDIEWTMGRTGQLTPVLIYNDIKIDGAVCNRASLHNISVMKQLMKGAFPGQRVFIYKANQIIPQVKYVQINNPRNVPLIKIPKKCPYCGKPTEIRNDNGSQILYCTNENCEGKLINRLDHFAGKKGLDIKGLSKATFEKLIDWGWINNIEDIFNLINYKNEWINKPGFGEKSVNKILKSIEQYKHTTLDSFISALGIPFIGRTAAKDLSKIFKTYEDFRAAVDNKDYDFSILDNFGEEMNRFIKNFDYAEADRISKIIFIENALVKKENKNNKLTGKNIVITGKLLNFKNRNELKAIIEDNGGKVTDSISSKTDILINNDIESESSKNKAAKKLGIPILSEADFIKSYIEN